MNQFYDIVVVDEAHHLRHQKTQVWQMVNRLQKKFIFLNTRSVIDLKLPKRFVTTLRLEPTEVEKKIYLWLTQYLRESAQNQRAPELLKQAGSSLWALKEGIKNIQGEIHQEINQTLAHPENLAKETALLELLRKKPDEKKIIFTQYLKTVDFLSDLLRRHEIPYVTFKGTMTAVEKDTAIQRFKEEVPVLISSESGGVRSKERISNSVTPSSILIFLGTPCALNRELEDFIESDKQEMSSSLT